MADFPHLIVFKSRGRDLTALQQACEQNDLLFELVNSEDHFQTIVKRHFTPCIVVPLSAGKERDDLYEFANVAARILQPEDADVSIYYSLEGFTPIPPWNGTLDPRPIQNMEKPELILGDINWQGTIEKIRDLKNKDYYHRCLVKGISRIELEDFKDVPFPSQAYYLLRAAFKDMSRISVKFPQQGLSGSIACVIEPFGRSGEPCKHMFAKIYPDHEKAQKELYNFRVLKMYIDSAYYPEYDDARRYRGNAYSLVVTDLARGPNGQLLTFKDIFSLGQFNVNIVSEFTEDILYILDKLPRSKPTNRIDLIDNYVTKYLDNPDMERTLAAYNDCHRWFGDFADELTLKEKIRRSIPKIAVEGSVSGYCHGDLHLENIMLKDIRGKIVPAIIDYSRTSITAHSVKDLVTLEVDLIIRGLRGIKAFITRDKIIDFLNLISVEKDIKKDFEPQDLLQIEKVERAIKTLRTFALKVHEVTEVEYFGAALLKTLEVLSYGKLPFDQNERATTYVTYLLERLKAAS